MVKNTKKNEQHPSDSQAAQQPNMRAKEWENKTSWPLLFLSLVFIGLSVVALADNNLSRESNVVAAAILVVLWVIFFADFGVRMFLSDARMKYFRSHLFEAVSLIFPLLRAFLVVMYLWRLPQFKRSHEHQRLRFMVVAAAFGFVFVFVASTLVYLLEHDVPGASIISFGDAVWWGFVTITTVGYGDYAPVTVLGRVVAVGLMLGGIVIIGSVSATVISALNDQLTKGANKQVGVPEDDNRS